jgi:hypothetical protein
MSSTLALTTWTIAAAIITGLLLALLGSLKLAMARRPERITAPLTLLLLLLNIVLLPLVVASGLLVDYWGLRPMMITGPVLLALSLLALSARPNYHRTQIAVVGAALAATSIAATSVALMPRALFGESELVASLQLGMVFVGLGALVAAPLVDLLFRAIGFRRTMAGLALVCLLPAFLIVGIDAGALASPQPVGGIWWLIETPGVWLGALVFFFYAPLEGFVSVWVFKYLEYLGESPRRATRLLIGFWAALVLSRLLLAVIQHSTNSPDVPWDHLSPWFVIIPALLVAALLGNLAATTKVGQIGWGLVGLGLLMGPIYPLVIGLVFRKLDFSPPDVVAIHPAFPGTAFALLSAGGSLGGLVLSPLLGFCARSRSLPVALLIPTMVALLLTGAAVLFGLQLQG